MSYSKKSGLDNLAFELNERGENAKSAQKSQTADNVQGRAQWGNSIEFLMSCVAMSVGLGNIWRFPFTVYENGGGAFLIPYIIILIFVGIPLYYMEMSLGQFSNRGNVRFFKSLSPFLKGVGYGQVIGVTCIATYYCSLIAITLFYLVNSFSSDLPWGKCWDEWETYLNTTGKNCVAASAVGSDYRDSNNTVSSSELFFTQEVLKEKTDISDGIGYPEWRLTLGLFISWIITFLVSVKGVQSSGKASYFLALFPYVIMFALLVRAVTLEGAATGMYYFIRTDWNKMAQPKVWFAAATQCFFSLNVGFGSLIMLSSYNSFDHNVYRDALIVATLDTFTSLLSGVTTFGILGNLAHNLGVTPDKVINSGGTSLAFISYPDALVKMNAVPWLFSILFFFMLFVLGVGSLVALHGTVNTVVQDTFPRLKPWQVSGYTAIAGFVIGLCYVTPGGQFMLNLVDYFGGTFIIFLFTIIEVISVAWVYGIPNFALDLEFMLKRKVNTFWRVTWGFITPITLVAILVFTCATFKRPTYADFSYPDGVMAIGWLILGVSLFQFLFWIGYYIYKNREFGYPKMIEKTFSNENWGPNGKEKYDDWRKMKDEALSKSNSQGKSRFKKCINALIGR